MFCRALLAWRYPSLNEYALPYLLSNSIGYVLTHDVMREPPRHSSELSIRCDCRIGSFSVRRIDPFHKAPKPKQQPVDSEHILRLSSNEIRSTVQYLKPTNRNLA